MAKNTFFSANLLINARGRLLDLSEPKVMSILNLTPDSFFDGNVLRSESDLLKRVDADFAHGTLLFDLGAASSRPGALEIDVEEEWIRLKPILKLIRTRYPDLFISVDTYRSEIARRAADEGCDLINDISGGMLDPQMFKIAGKSGLPYILMHMRGNPQTMSSLNQYDDILLDMASYFRDRIFLARESGIKDIILDPGFGFSKNQTQNYEVLRRMAELKIFELPVLAGISRKGMIYKTLETDPESALNGSTAAHMLALANGASILRVHDVKEAVECLRIWKAYRGEAVYTS